MRLAPWHVCYACIALSIPLVNGCTRTESTPQTPQTQPSEDFSGSRVHQLNGKVTINGSPVKEGVIKLIDASGRSMESLIESDGAFKIVGITPGPHKVSIESRNAPGKYSNAETSGLSIDLKRGVNTHNFELATE